MKITIEFNSIEELKEFEAHCVFFKMETMKNKLNEKIGQLNNVDTELRECRSKLLIADAKIKGLEKEANRLKVEKKELGIGVDLNKEVLF